MKLPWKKFVIMMSVLFTCSVNAQVYATSFLNEASNLVEISPNKAQQLAQNFLDSRKLTSMGNNKPTPVSRDESASSIRTPSGSIDAYKILAEAEFNLGNMHEAMEYLATAIDLAKKHDIKFSILDIKLLQIELNWRSDGDTHKAETRLASIQTKLQNVQDNLSIVKMVKYRALLLQARLESSRNNTKKAEFYYAKAQHYINKTRIKRLVIDYHLEVGEFYLKHQQYNHALSELLFGYWQSVESNLSLRLAKSNRLLAELFFKRRVLDKSLEHWSQAADYYGNFPDSPLLAHVLKNMGDAYFQQGKYNLALVQYFNVLDHESTERHISQLVSVRLSLAATYLKVKNYPLAEKYLEHSVELLSFTHIPEFKIKAALLKSELALHNKKGNEVIKYADKALSIAQKNNNETGEQSAYKLLAAGYEENNQLAQSLKYIKLYNQLVADEQTKLNQISEDAFRQQKEFAEQTLHYVGQANKLSRLKVEHDKYKKITFALLLTGLVLFMLVLHRGYLISKKTQIIKELTKDLYTHSRSHLRNLRMLNAKLSYSLQQANDTFEQWQLGELINEPLNDRLRFVMIDLPFLRNMYMQHGYKAGLELEEEFGKYLEQQIQDPARLYHFSDTNLLYIEKNTDRNESPEIIFNKVQKWINEFKPSRNINFTIRMGIADYPFLPRAYTAINDQELLDILLMATHLARDISLREKNSQWAYFRAIDNAPAASLAKGNIRDACKHAIQQGLIKIQSSSQNEDSIKKMLKDE